MNNRLIVITGPTASGKTAMAIKLARKLGTEIISADSRQLFHEIPIGTAQPNTEELSAVRHHFIGTLSLTDYYSAAKYEEDVLGVLPGIFARCGERAVMCGGSMMYVDAVCKGIDQLPTVSAEVRQYALDLWEKGGNQAIIDQLRHLDPNYLNTVDLQNHRRLVHALEICLESGKSYSELCTGQVKARPFEIKKYAIDLPREELFDRINRRVEQMIDNGLVEEARKVYHLRHLNSLNTVGYKELFAFFDGLWDLPTAIARIQKNTRVYAKKQLTWLRRDPSVHWLNAVQSEEIDLTLLKI